MSFLTNKKFKIKKAYERYKSGVGSDSSNLRRLLKYFCIYLDDLDAKDYSVDVDLQSLSLKLVDNKNNTSYVSKYDSKDTVTTKVAAPEYFLKTVYSTETFKPIIQICTIDDGEHQLSYTKYHEKKDEMITDRVTLNYFLVKYNNKLQEKQSLLFQSHLISQNGQVQQEQKHFDIFSGFKTYLSGDAKDEDVYILGDNILYSINKNELQNGTFSGFCLLDNSIEKKSIYDLIPSSISLGRYQHLLKDKDIKSVMCFFGYDKSGNGFLTVYKTDSDIVLNYERNDKDERCNKRRILSIPSLTDGAITVDELKQVEEELETSFPNDLFMPLFSSKIASFTSEVKKHQLKDSDMGLVEELCRSDDFSKTLNELMQNKEFYFQKMHDTFIDKSSPTTEKSKGRNLTKRLSDKRIGVRI